MNKAKFIGKSYGTGYNSAFVYLEYEYRGRKYEVYENRAKGNIPLRWQHANEQARIDRLIEQEERTKQYTSADRTEDALNRLFDYWNGNEEAFN